MSLGTCTCWYLASAATIFPTAICTPAAPGVVDAVGVVPGNAKRLSSAS